MVRRRLDFDRFMVLYDFLAPAYDPLLKPFYAPFRRRAFATLNIAAGSTVLDLACGTGQNFPHLAALLGTKGRVIGVDISRGMLRKAKQTAAKIDGLRIDLIHTDATQMLPDVLKEKTGMNSVDAVVCTFGFTAMRNWEEALHQAFALLRPGGTFFIHDIFAERRNLHVAAFELGTRVDLSRRSWTLLQAQCADFRFEHLDPSAHLFAGRVFVATGVKLP